MSDNVTYIVPGSADDRLHSLELIAGAAAGLAESALGRAARALYMIGSARAVNLGTAIEPILGEVQKMLAAAKAPRAAKPAEAELIS